MRRLEEYLLGRIEKEQVVLSEKEKELIEELTGCLRPKDELRKSGINNIGSVTVTNS